MSEIFGFKLLKRLYYSAVRGFYKALVGWALPTTSRQQAVQAIGGLRK